MVEVCSEAAFQPEDALWKEVERILRNATLYGLFDSGNESDESFDLNNN